MKKYKLIFIIVAIAILNSFLYSCSVCTTAYADLFLPPVQLWFLFSIIVYIIESIVVTKCKNKVWGIPTIIKAILLVFLYLFLGAAFLGFGFPILLVIPVIVVTIQSYLSNKPSNWNQKFQAHQKFIRIPVTLGMVLMIGYSIFIHINRTPADFILKWRSAVPASVSLRSLIDEGEESLSEIRKILKQCKPFTASKIAPYISKHGTPEIDVPLLITALANAQERNYRWYVEPIENALYELSKLQLDRGSPAKEWRDAWGNKKNKSK